MSDTTYGPYCEWPNHLASGQVVTPTSLEERRKAWDALQPWGYEREERRRKAYVTPATAGQNRLAGRQRARGKEAWGTVRTQLLKRNVIVWEGPSQLTGAPIYVVATAATSNRKIGAMVQLWILTAGTNPIEAVKTGQDAAICGDCKLRGDGTGKARACYVEWWRVVNHIHQAATGTGRGRGIVDRMTPAEFAECVRGLQVRIGAYGDPAAVPLEVWRPMLRTAAGWTAYTHQWRTANLAYADFCMASVDTPDEQIAAVEMGYRTFRVRTDVDAPVFDDEVICPASEEAGHRATCDHCSLCRGLKRPAKNIVIVAHGQRALHFTPSVSPLTLHRKHP